MLEVFLIFLRLGFTSFGGPIAHLSYFHEEFVGKRKWFDESSYADLVGICQFLPGPASSQVGIAIGLSRAGIPGAVAAWLGFTLPSAVMLVVFALGVSSYNRFVADGWLHGLKIVAVAVVAQAVWSMGGKLITDAKRASIAVLAAVCTLLSPTTYGQIGVIVLGALLGVAIIRETSEGPKGLLKLGLGPVAGGISLILLFLLLFLLPVLAHQSDLQALKLFDSFFRAGSLVFGGGHVVLPLLKAEVVNPGWVTSDAFLAGYGAAQAIPGPLFAFSAYLGAVSKHEPSGILGAAICLVAAFMPSFFLVFGTLPFWERLRRLRRMRNMMTGINAAVVGLLVAALYSPVWTNAIFAPQDFALAIVCCFLLIYLRTPSWLVVVIGALVGGVFL